MSYHHHHLRPVLCVQQASRRHTDATLPCQSPHHLLRRDGRPLTNMGVAYNLLATHLGNNLIRHMYQVQPSSAPPACVNSCCAKCECLSVPVAIRALLNQLHSCVFCQLFPMKQHALTCGHACPESQSLFANTTKDSIKIRHQCDCLAAMQDLPCVINRQWPFTCILSTKAVSVPVVV